MQLINKEKNSDPVIVQVPPPPEIAAAIKRETDILTAATSLSRGIKREPEEALVAGSVKRTRYEGEISSPVSEDCYGSSSDSITGELAVPLGVNVPVQRDTVSPEYNMANIETADLPGLDDMLSTESKIVRTQIDGYNSYFYFQCLGLSSGSAHHRQRRITVTTLTTVREYVICSISCDLSSHHGANGASSRPRYGGQEGTN